MLYQFQLDYLKQRDYMIKAYIFFKKAKNVTPIPPVLSNWIGLLYITVSANSQGIICVVQFYNIC